MWKSRWASAVLCTRRPRRANDAPCPAHRASSGRKAALSCLSPLSRPEYSRPSWSERPHHRPPARLLVTNGPATVGWGQYAGRAAPSKAEGGYRMANLCPKCNQDDRMDKVSMIVRKGTVGGTSSAVTHSITHSEDGWGGRVGHSHGSSYSMTAHAARLAPPAEPEMQPMWPVYLGTIMLLSIGSPGRGSMPVMLPPMETST